MPANAAPLKPEVLTEADLRSEAVARNLERLAWLMDRAIPIPGTNLRVGLDAILGLIPGGGDFVCGLIQTGLVLTALQHYRVPKVVAARMAANVLIDLGVRLHPLARRRLRRGLQGQHPQPQAPRRGPPASEPRGTGAGGPFRLVSDRDRRLLLLPWA